MMSLSWPVSCATLTVPMLLAGTVIVVFCFLAMTVVTVCQHQRAVPACEMQRPGSSEMFTVNSNIK